MKHETIEDCRRLMRGTETRPWRFRTDARAYAHGWGMELRKSRQTTPEQRANETRILKICRAFLSTGRKQG